MKDLKKTQQILMTVFAGLLALTLIVVVLYETDILSAGRNALDKNAEFMQLTIMELATLGCVVLALRLFKFKEIHQSLINDKAPALLKFGMFRLMLLELPMLSNTLFYYMYMNTAFGYMAIILLICLPFVVPTMNRCIAETTEDDPV